MPDAAPPRPTTVIAIDFGTRQIGLAVGQTLLGSARPLTVIKARDGQPDWADLARRIAEWQPELLLVGLPLNMDGTESEFCARARRFARRLHGRVGIAVKMVDERLSTAAAKTAGARPISYRDNPVDGLAAALILGTWMQNRDLGLEP